MHAKSADTEETLQHESLIAHAWFSVLGAPPWIVTGTLSFLLLLALVPVVRCRRALRCTTLTHACGWAGAALLVWSGSLAASAVLETSFWLSHVRYLAAAAGMCPFVAVLGARRPGVRPWNFVVVAMLLVLAMPSLESLGWAAPTRLSLDGPRSLFTALVLSVGILNYLPTRYAPAMLLFAVAEISQLAPLSVWTQQRVRSPEVHWNVAAVALLGALSVAWARAAEGERFNRSAADRLWRAYRDLFGLVWGRRLQDRFNARAKESDLPLRLVWTGFRRTSLSVATWSEERAHKEAVRILRTLLTRFASPEWINRQLAD